MSVLLLTSKHRGRSYVPAMPPPVGARPTFGPTFGNLYPGITENYNTGRTEGTPNNITVRYPLVSGGVVHNNVDTEAKFRTALNAVRNSNTNDIIVLTADFELAPFLSLPPRNNVNLKCDIVCAAEYAGSFISDTTQVQDSTPGVISIIRALNANANAYIDFGRSNSVATELTSGYRFIGVRFTPHPSQVYHAGYFMFIGDEGARQNAISKVPKRIGFDRCIWDGGINTECKGAMSFSAMDSWIINSRITHWWSRNRGPAQWADVPGILVLNTPGGLYFENNNIDALSLPIMLGGGGQNVQVPLRGVVIRRNRIWKDWAFYLSKVSDPTHLTAKNLFEFKIGDHIYMEDNHLEGSRELVPTGGGQNASALIPKLQSYGSPNFDPISGHFLFRGNRVRGFAIGMWPNGKDVTTDPSTGPNDYLKELHVVDNAWEEWNVSPYNWGNPRILLFAATPVGTMFLEHNTWVTPSTSVVNGQWMSIDGNLGNTPGSAIDLLHFRRNVVPWGHNAASSGTGGIAKGIGPTAPGGAFGDAALAASCVAYDVSDNLVLRPNGPPTGYPAGNVYPTDWSQLYEASDIASLNWRLKAAYADRLADDGWPRGVSDWDHFLARLAGV